MENQDKIMYVFFGKVFPERADVNISELILNVLSPEAGLHGDLTVSVTSSQIKAIFTTEREIPDPLTIRNYVEESVRLLIDILGYINGCGYDLEIATMINTRTNESIVFGVDSVLFNMREDRPLNFGEIISLFDSEKADYIRRCLSDLREAVRVPKDTGFFCYRALETLRKFFIKENELKSDKESWEFLRSELEVDRSTTDFVKQFADPVRHGETKYITGYERDQILKNTWEIVDKFLVYAKNGYKK
ncbi:MAG: hypothetical protein CVV34_05690 [Methanomicrobiales archaeon HGW-Methanomicrobiales-5]|jgi:hypothetical protein|nr:MAG: hypothetical protein CVV34_05690 [Methanomicrobiales archaeon HGW-Methanomicrobiales-5]